MPTYGVRTRHGIMYLHGDLGDHCADCGDVASHLCDYPIGGDKTCDRKLCERHGRTVGDDMHYCRTHYREWRAHYPDKPEYRYTHLRLKTLPGMAHAAMALLKEEFDRRDQGERGGRLPVFLHNSAIPLGTDAARAGMGPVDDAPYESLAGGLWWCIEHALVEVCWRKPPGASPQPWFALTSQGLAVMEGHTVERMDEER